jgi:predicted ATPase/DNA-binding XRE family transcriptional regulator/Tfp pilus assembly protein PilF
VGETLRIGSHRGLDGEPVAFGSLLRELRLTAGLTQEELAERAQLSERAIRALERGQGRTPRLQTIRLLAQALGLDNDGQSRLLAAARPVAIDRNARGRAAPLPRFLTPAVGRWEDATIVKLLLDHRRLVTLRGTGGVGKTRLALLVAEQVSDAFDRVVFVELAPLRETDHVTAAIASALSVREEPARSLVDLIAGDLESGRALLVLDNMEHLLTARDLVLSLLGLCPDLSILVTSREALHVRGERVYTVGPLALPEREVDIGRSPAVRLFLERAADAGADLAKDATTAAAVAEICRRLDGLPLAIELAAAWAPTLSPQTLLARLTSRLPFLDLGPEDLPARQRTMRATVDWSHNLLSRDEKALFARLSVFTGGCTLEAADAVCQGVAHLELDTLAGLGSLREKSLVTVHEQETPALGAPAMRGPRFGMLETVKEFASDELGVRSEAREAQREHARCFLTLAEEARPKLSGPDQWAWLTRLEQEHDNLRGALRTAQETKDTGLGLRLAGSLWPFWRARGHFEEAQKWLDEFLPRPDSADVSPFDHAYALFAAGDLIGVRGDNDLSISVLQRTLSLAKHTGNEGCAAATLHLLGATECARGHYPTSEGRLEESLAIYRRVDDQPGVCMVLSTWAGVARYQGDYRRAGELYQEALDLSRATGDLGRVAEVLARLGNMATERGRPAKSPALYEEALALHRQIGDDFGVADVLERRGETATSIGDYAGALTYYEESLELYRSLGTSYGVAYVLLNQSEAAIGMGNLDEAIELVEQSLALFRKIDDDRCIAFALMHLGDAARVQHDYRRAIRLYEESVTLHHKLNTRPQIARCLERMACVAYAEELEERAARLHGAAAALRVGMSSSMTPAERVWYDRSITTVRERMGDEAFAARDAEGRSMSLEQAVEYAIAESPAGLPYA